VTENKKLDPWELLREARESVYQHKERLQDCDHEHETCTCDLAAKKIVLLSSIDAALAEPVNKCVRCEELQEDLDEADEDLEIANLKLKEIVELVGEGGDGTAFGSVESMLATFDYRQKLLVKQRDEARAEVKRLKNVLSDAIQAWKDANGYDDLFKAYSQAVDERNSARDEIERLQAALAERQDSATDVVESETVEWFRDSSGAIQSAKVGRATVSVSKQIGNEYWWWTINYAMGGPTEGWVKTESDAKTAAIRAALGLR
jgi:hypothetical protein